MQLGFRIGLVLAYTLGPFGSSLSTARTKTTPAEEAVDISAGKDRLRIFTDGKKHYIALIPFDFNGPLFFYGDGQTFWAQRPYGGGRDGDSSFDRSFWEPRAQNRKESMFQFHDKKYSLFCSTRETPFTPLSEAENTAMLGSAKFLRPRWKHQSYWLAKDDKSRYYFVDRMREPEGNKAFRLFVGPKGSLKLLKMTNVVSDTHGDRFSTKSGELRLIGSNEGLWIVGKSKTNLQLVPIEDNHVLVYKDLGVYAGEKLGTPCDDL
jgi:hypothetical protein